MDNREKLIDVFMHLDRHIENRDEYGICYTSDFVEAVETVLQILKNGVTVQKWIPVTERLPDEDGKYLVFEKSGGRTNTSILQFAKDARKVDRYDFKGRWKNAWYEYDSEWGHYTVDSVTHWMPLPQPPKGE